MDFEENITFGKVIPGKAIWKNPSRKSNLEKSIRENQFGKSIREDQFGKIHPGKPIRENQSEKQKKRTINIFYKYSINI